MTTDVEVSAKSEAQQFHDEVAGRIAAELRHGPGECRLAKVTSLVHAFRFPGAHTDIADVVKALSARDVNTEPRLPDIVRRGVLELKLDAEAESDPSTVDRTHGIQMSVWRPGTAGRAEGPIPEGGTRRDRDPDEVLWFTVDALPGDPTGQGFEDRVHNIAAQLKPWCADLDERMVADLMTPDLVPKVETYGDERTGIRSISVAAVIARESVDDDDDFDGKAEQLVFQTVEMIVGKGWILTCWHPSRTFMGTGEGEAGPPILREPILSHVAHRWLHEPHSSKNGRTSPKDSGDLGLYLARSLAATYGASLRMMQRWVSAWEAEFYLSLSSEDKPRKLRAAAGEISNFLSMVGEFHRRLSAFRLAGEEMPNKSWFPDHEGAGDGDAQHERSDALASAVATAEDKLDHLSAEIRSDMDLLMIHSQATQQESSEKLQSYLGKVTGLVLVPTLVAGLFGANTALPGQGSWSGFDLMVVLMVVSAIAAYLAMRKLTR